MVICLQVNGDNAWFKREDLMMVTYAHKFVEIVNRIQVQRLIPVKASQFVTGTSIA